MDGDVMGRNLGEPCLPLALYKADEIVRVWLSDIRNAGVMYGCE